MNAKEALSFGMGAIIAASEGKGVIIVGLPGEGGRFGFAPIFVNTDLMDAGDPIEVGALLGMEVIAVWRQMRENEAAEPDPPRIIRPDFGLKGIKENGEIV